MNASAILRKMKTAALDALYPSGNVCAACGTPLLYENERAVCEECFAELQGELLPPRERMSRRPPEGVAEAAAAFAYSGMARRMAQLMKYDTALMLCMTLGAAMSACAAEAGMLDTDALVPVPLGKGRLAERGYNQAELLAEALSRFTGLPVDTRALMRVRETATQVKLSRERRLENMLGAFLASPDRVCGKKLLLVDDVLTTGATASACAKALTVVGAKSVSLITCCRA